MPKNTGRGSRRAHQAPRSPGGWFHGFEDPGAYRRHERLLDVCLYVALVVFAGGPLAAAVLLLVVEFRP